MHEEENAERSLEIEILNRPNKQGKGGKERRTRNRFVSDYAQLIKLMSTAQLHENTRREILYQAVRMYSGQNGYFDDRAYTYISNEAEQLCDQFGKQMVPKTTVREHVVPIKVSIEWLWRASELSEVDLQKLLKDASTICIVSTDEDRRLGKANKDKMPSYWSRETGNIWARYDELDIKRRPLDS